MLEANKHIARFVRDGYESQANLDAREELVGVSMREMPESFAQTVIQSLWLYNLTNNPAFSITSRDYFLLVLSPCISVVSIITTLCSLAALQRGRHKAKQAQQEVTDHEMEPAGVDSSSSHYSGKCVTLSHASNASPTACAACSVFGLGSPNRKIRKSLKQTSRKR